MPSLATIARNKQLKNPEYDFISGPHQHMLLQQRIRDLIDSGGPYGLDTETGGPGKKDGLLPWRGRVRLVQVATKDYCVIVDLDGWRSSEPAKDRGVPWQRPGLAELKALIESDTPKILQKAVFDLTWLSTTGVMVGGNIFDTLIGAKLVNAGTNRKNDLGFLAERYLKVELDKTSQKEDWAMEVLPKEMRDYAARDALILPMLVEPIKEALIKASLWHVFQLEMAILRPVAEMWWNGFGFNTVAASALLKQLTEQEDAAKMLFIEKLDQRLQLEFPNTPSDWLPRDPDGSFNLRAKDSGKVRDGTKKLKGFNVDSPVQVAAAVMKCGVILQPTKTGKFSMDKNFLAWVEVDREHFPEDTVDLVLSYKAYKSCSTLVKHVTTLLDAVEVDGRIHATYNQLGAATGRMSCSAVNLQQVPSKPPHGKAFRSLFLAGPGYKLVIADFGQIEIRVAADVSGETAMIEAYRAGRDLHTETAARMLDTDPDVLQKLVDDGDENANAARKPAKILNFGMLFGANGDTVKNQAMSQYNVEWTTAEAHERVAAFRRAYPTFYKWQQSTGNETTSAVFTKLGRRRMTVGMHRQYTGRLNTPIQGCAGDIAKLAIRNIWKDIVAAPPGEVFLVSVVHDEIILEVKEGFTNKWEKLLSAAMVAGGEELIQSLPIVADAGSGDTWAEAK